MEFELLFDLAQTYCQKRDFQSCSDHSPAHAKLVTAMT